MCAGNGKLRTADTCAMTADMVVAWIALTCAINDHKQGFKVFQIFGYFIKKVTRNVNVFLNVNE